MHIKVKETSLYYIIASAVLVYILTFGYWDARSSTAKLLFNGAMILGIFLYFITISEHKIRVFNSNTTLLFVCTIIYYIFSGLLLSDNRVLINGLYSYVYYQLLILAWIYLFRKINITKLFPIFEIVGVVSSVLGVYEVLSGKLLLGGRAFGKTFIGSYVVRAVVFSGSFLTLGMFLAIIVIIALYLYLKNKRIIHVAVVGVCIMGLFMTSSRGPMVAAVVGMIAIYLMNGTTSISKRVSRVVSLILIIAVIVSVFLILANTIMSDNFYFAYVSNRLASIIDWSGESGNIGRVNRWALFSQRFSQHWLFGTGIGTSGTRAAELIGGLNTESGVFKRLLELGVLGFVLYYSFVLSMLRQGFKYYSETAKKEHISALPVALAILVSILVEELVMQITETIMVSALMWMFFGYVVLSSQGHVDRTLSDK